MFLHNDTLLIIFVLGIILAIVGFGFRDRNPGLILLGIGFLITLFVVVQKAADVFGG
ncbi:MAG: hypothetical protein AB7E12_06520 [Burkholderiaceae bacterium]|jgi:hypothetical protein